MFSMPTHKSFPFESPVQSICPPIVRNVEAVIVLRLLEGPPPEVSGLQAQSGTTILSDSLMLVVDEPENG